jgi:hypothetical protein
MTDDIVVRLRDLGDRAAFEPSAHHKAADEIETLRAALRLLIEWHDDTGAVMLPVLIDVARAALEGEKTND